ncbi:diaminopropionate ammonia-lyase [Pedobacter terrae]|uniref:Diaminopropionate ammonia-lyase n=1 Tax=Pedobacter terrae TaxID=405671 RepID=A0A1G8EJL5_9SPHI|nr:diaminopropionate ammonia-lyase [Pedobacter terrae]SDH70020.1 diaminopropionate ammonia-lyase [Pedobacter terrae]
MLLVNKMAQKGLPLDIGDAELLTPSVVKKAQDFWASRNEYTITPLHSLTALAKHYGIAGIHVKDEDYRLGLHSFKALGGTYAVFCIIMEEAQNRLGRRIMFDEISHPDVKKIASQIIFTCATDGNHGRSVAAGAQIVGAKSVIFVHEGVSQKRREAIAAYGASIEEVKGTYDDSIVTASRMIKDKGWIMVSDTSWQGYERVPGLIMQGYTTLLTEALLQLEELPSHVFIQAGVGGLASAIAGHLFLLFGEKRPKIVIVEPESAACIYESAKNGCSVKINPGKPTVMAMLECYEPSMIAWRILSRIADGFITISEKEAVDTMRLLAMPRGNDPFIVSGESGGAGLAGLIQICENTSLMSELRIDRGSRILIFNTEGATDSQRYIELVGQRPQDIYLKNENRPDL